MTGSELRVLREVSGLAQSHLAEMVGVAQPTVANWEHERSPITDENAAKIMKAFKEETERKRQIANIQKAFSRQDVFDLRDEIMHLNNVVSSIQNLSEQSQAYIFHLLSRSFNPKSHASTNGVAHV